MTLRSMIDNFSCFADKKKNYFANAPTVEITNLPQVRLMMCGYESQCALQFAAYLFMREQLGVNVTFYPTLDYDDIWGDAHWNWSAPLAYPRKYFEWLADDEGDLQFEIWQTQMLRTDGTGLETFNGESEFILEGRVDFGGFVGAYGEESVWVPSYVLRNASDFFIPASLRDNAEYRAQLIAAATGAYDGAAGATDFVALYADSADFDAPTNATPTVWTSKASYFGSEYSRDLIATPPNALDMNFVATGSEASLAALVTELYAARQPLLAYIYTLDVNFGRVDAATGELQQFEKLVYPRNPDQSADDPCYDANSSTEKWLHAACAWMKDEKSAATWDTGAWDVEITRKDCLDGCGIGGVGGACNYYTGECECAHAELFADTHCTESCPGLLGPVLNESSGDWDFEFCSGRGVCNVKTRQCACDEGYGDAGY